MFFNKEIILKILINLTQIKQFINPMPILSNKWINKNNSIKLILILISIKT